MVKEGGVLGHNREEYLVPRPSSSHLCGKTPFLKNFVAFLDEYRGSYFRIVWEVWTSIPPLGIQLLVLIHVKRFGCSLEC